MRLGMGLRLSDILKAGAVVKSTLVNGLVSYWPLNEQSGTRNDVVGANHLTDNNTVLYDTGVNGAAASFVAANSEYLSQGMNLTGASFSVSLWTKSTAAAGSRIVQDGAVRSWTVDYDGSSYRFYVNGGAQGGIHGIASDSTVWHHLLATYDSSVGTYGTTYFWVDGVASPQGAVAIAAAMADGAAQDLQIGGRPTFGDYTSGQIDEVAIWSRVLTADERTELYNAGDGFFYNATTEDFE